MTDSEQGQPGHRPSEERAAALTGRLVALSDGVYAIALTLLVLNISVPPELGDAAFHDALRDQLPNLGAYALSFLVIAQFWRDNRYVLDRVDASVDRGGHLALLGLGLVALLPFPTALLAEYGGTHSVATAGYAATVAAVYGTHLALLVTCEPRRRPADTVQRLAVTDLALSAAVFAASIPIAFLSAAAGMLTWLALIPVKALVTAGQRRAARREGALPIG
ncbi:TMEM175 family protein [Streptomyces bohaiensis]|uniref:TMEM175 family protein n=1 Tax=Streptomyces bohaiensis TaxID=1431344 RepID=UPI003B792A23